MQIVELQDLLWRHLTDNPAAWPEGMLKIATTDTAGYLGSSTLGRFDLVTAWNSQPDRAGLDKWITATVENIEHPGVAQVEPGFDQPNAWFGQDGLRLTFTDDSQAFIRYLPDPEDGRVLHIRLIGAAPLGGKRDDADPTLEARSLLLGLREAQLHERDREVTERYEPDIHELVGSTAEVPHRVAARPEGEGSGAHCYPDTRVGIS